MSSDTGMMIAQLSKSYGDVARLKAALKLLADSKGHTMHKPAGQKAYAAVVIPREIFEAAMRMAAEEE